MQLDLLKISNFRALKDVDIPLSEFGCLIGENNAGKSSVLHALVLALTGSAPRKVSDSDFHDRTQPIRIELHIKDIDDSDLGRITDANHRTSLASCVENGELTLVRIIAVDGGKQSLRVRTLGPANRNLTDDVLAPAMKGKSGSGIRSAVVDLVPELDPLLTAKPTQVSIREARDKIVAGLGEHEKELQDKALPTGIDAAIKPFLPEPIYIEAVKDVISDVKTTDTATFGKLIKILLDEVADQFDDVQEHFGEIQKRLTRVFDPDGSVQDLRLDPVKKIESTIQGFVRESFPDIELKMSVPVPGLKALFSTAEINVDDGHDGSIASKGDGLKRTVAFAILRAYTELRADGLGSTTRSATTKPSYLLLFEEPELYLHPRGQRQLFRALEIFAQDHPVLVTTHSPTFFSASSTSTFTKLRKYPSAATVPESTALPIDLRSSVDERAAFQIICHENNESAFFARAVVLVEGESDEIVFSHLARLFDPTWDHVEQNISFIRVGGKQNISKYRNFFNNFDIDVHVLCDLDAILDGYQHLFNDTKRVLLRNQLLDRVNSLIPQPDNVGINGQRADKISRRGDLRAHWDSAAKSFSEWDGSAEGFEEIRSSITGFFATANGSKPTLAVLKSDDTEVIRLKGQLLEDLRQEKIYVLSQGDLEAYYGDFEATGANDKVRHAIKFRNELSDYQSFEALHNGSGTHVLDELRTIMSHMFDEPAYN